MIATFTEVSLGAVLGAALALGAGIVTELWRDGRAARAASKLIFAELAMNGAQIGVYREHGQFPAMPIQRSAWSEHGADLVRGSGYKVFDAVQNAYGRLTEIELFKSAAWVNAGQAPPEGNIDLATGAIANALQVIAGPAGVAPKELEARLDWLERPGA